jgi:hypothetical protein
LPCQVEELPPPVIVNGEGEYEVARFEDSRVL